MGLFTEQKLVMIFSLLNLINSKKQAFFKKKMNIFEVGMHLITLVSQI